MLRFPNDQNESIQLARAVKHRRDPSRIRSEQKKFRRAPFSPTTNSRAKTYRPVPLNIRRSRQSALDTPLVSSFRISGFPDVPT